MNSKIQREINELVDKQVISKEIASKIERYYASKHVSSPNRLFTIFGVLGALLTGLGIILILAHNWDDFSRTLKTTLAFVPLIIGQIFVGFSILKKKSIVWKEASGTFLFFAVGSSISLVSQIYNIPGNLSNFLLLWILLCTPLIYLLRAHTLAILHLIFATYYAVEYGYSFMTYGNTPWVYLFLLVLFVPHYWKLLKQRPLSNITSIFNWMFPLSLIIVLGAFVKTQGELGFLMYVVLFGLLYNIGKVPFFDAQKLRMNGYLVLGSLGTMYMLFLTSFKWLWSDIFSSEIVYNSQEFYTCLFLFLLVLCLLIYSHVKNWMIHFNPFRYVFLIFTVVFFMALGNNTIPVILINVLVLILGIAAVKIGADKFHFGILNYGLLIITMLIVCRFFDTNISFVLRGLLFVIVGIGFFLTNYMMLKRQKVRKENLKK